MCEYEDLSSPKCGITSSVCPYLYYCYRTLKYKESMHMPDVCKVKEAYEAPKGFYKVSYGKRNNLYVIKDNIIIIVDNPYDYIPTYVKMEMKNGSWKITESVR